MATAVDIAKVIYQADDLDKMQQAMTEFGLVPAVRTDTTLYMRGSASQHHIHETRLGDRPRFIGAAIEVAARADLDELAQLEGGSVESNPEPGGGWRVRMLTPDGFEITAIWGRELADPLTVRETHPFNSGQRKARVNASIRVRREPATVIRLGHFVLHVSSHDETVKWFEERFGMLHSDYFAPPGQQAPIVGTFLRCNQGSTLVDHHCLLILQSEKVGVHHCSFEVEDIDAVMVSHDYLLSRGWKLDCGVGRHMLGSQIFDYWKDPFGFRVEHYTDGDVVDASFQPSIFNGTASETTQWGDEPPLEFFTSCNE